MKVLVPLETESHFEENDWKDSFLSSLAKQKVDLSPTIKSLTSELFLWDINSLIIGEFNL